MSILTRHNARMTGSGNKAIMFAHGFGCDQNMWRFVAPAFEQDYRVVTFDHIGAGGSDLQAYGERHAALAGYAEDVVEVARAAGVRDGIFVGHSVSAMIGVLAAQLNPLLFERLVLVSPSPRYVDDDDYRGGFSRAEIDELLASIENNHLGWSATMAPVIMGNPDRPELGGELTESFCRSDPDIAAKFARATFLSDNRSDLAKVKAKTLILQCREDVIAPRAVGEYVHRAILGSKLVILDATGHCPNLSAPEATTSAIKAFLEIE